MIKILALLVSLNINLSIINNNDKIIVGAERINAYKNKIKNKSIGLLVNHTSTVGGTHLIDTLVSLEYDVKKIFIPEHGFSGMIERGVIVDDDTITINGIKIPIISMYGKERTPSKKNMEGLDVMIFDIQDVGARFYTYISAMHNMMKICAELGIEFIILDRPNPNGNYVDGPVLEKEFKSYVGMHEIPIVHGLTVGELAKMIIGERWVENSQRLKLTIIKTNNWDHKKEYILPIRPSPNLPNQKSILLYPSLCLFEQTIVSIGRGTKFPFQVIGHPDYKKTQFNFKPISVNEESKPKLEGRISYGIDLRYKDVEKKLKIDYLIDFYNELKNRNHNFFNKYFYRIAGTKKLENQIKSGLTESEIRSSWQEDLDNYKMKRKKYLLYQDFE
tara:strand:- start:6010 stop:7176 length:1167 start_codon:yes stop_codon:yes gene_type:complete